MSGREPRGQRKGLAYRTMWKEAIDRLSTMEIQCDRQQKVIDKQIAHIEAMHRKANQQHTHIYILNQQLENYRDEVRSLKND